MMLVPCYLAPSAIEGLGVFATVDIKKGDVVWRFDDRFDRLIPRTDILTCPDHLREFFERYTYEMPGFPDHMALDADEGRFMNHADHPNLDFTSSDRGIALVDIPVGVELTCDYRSFTIGDLVFQGPRHRVVTRSEEISQVAH